MSVKGEPKSEKGEQNMDTTRQQSAGNASRDIFGLEKL